MSVYTDTFRFTLLTLTNQINEARKHLWTVIGITRDLQHEAASGIQASNRWELLMRANDALDCLNDSLHDIEEYAQELEKLLKGEATHD